MYVICAMFHDTTMYVVGNGQFCFKTKESAREYFENSNLDDFKVTHYEIRKMQIL